MKNQYFGDVNDYRKYGLLRLIEDAGGVRIGVCWMLTENDHRPDGKRTKYLSGSRWKRFRQYDPSLFDVLREKVVGHEDDPAYRNVKHFNQSLLSNADWWRAKLHDGASDRESYFRDMYSQFKSAGVQLVFYDPDNGLANNFGQERMKKGAKESSKFLFRDEVERSVEHGWSVLIYQHFRQKANLENRRSFVNSVVNSLWAWAGSRSIVTFTTPDVFFLLIPAPVHLKSLKTAASNISQSRWSCRTGSTRSKTTDGRQILVQHHTLT